ncbi:MAG: protein-disulfide reductase DsbD family protein [Paracoccus sp. (in: a-proteobacteria)]|uniref:protein-disulfide reductase DsbD domain-containing protein n=1 Tax=Paracoccus sp. TaxID=267 RepID=UPI0026DFAD07|nr:protein-disulfide reductase DsbD domain-containing protein [Paracoccus sp. (in: a-proteobacteria)]MDO5612735.1 protein-disulfide reductase DsbD family protein [Paracoccus sp. (in: a-proteobacteria)]
MKALTLTALLACAALPAIAQDALPPGLVSARLLPGWTDAQGQRIAALELLLEPGWKTYWRSPGDTGLPPEFDWSGSANLAGVTLHWPAPEAIDSEGTVTLGYHESLILPLTATPADAAAPVDLVARIDLGLCENVCVPAHLALSAPQAGATPDPQISAAMAQVPAPAQGPAPACTIRPIRDGMQVALTLPGDTAPHVAAMELDGDQPVWASGAVIEGQTVTADFVPPAGKPFDLDPAQIVLTLIQPDGATEHRGCAPQG